MARKKETDYFEAFVGGVNSACAAADMLCTVFDHYEPEALPEDVENAKLDDPVRMYLKEIGRIKLLSPEEEQDVARKMVEGDEATREAEGWCPTPPFTACPPLTGKISWSFPAPSTT